MICSLQAAMDLAYLHVCLKICMGWKSFHHIRGEKYTEYVGKILNQESGIIGCTENLFLTCACMQGSKHPTASSLTRDLGKYIGSSCDGLVVISVSDIRKPQEDHLKRASELKMEIQPHGVYCVEIALVRDNAARCGLLRSEIMKASKDGRKEDELRLRSQLSELQAATMASRTDAQLLAQVLESDFFSRVLGDSRRELHFSSAIDALNEFCRMSGNMRHHRSTRDTRNKILEISETLELNFKHAEILCSMSEQELVEIVEKGTQTTASRLKERVVSIYNTRRTELVNRLSNPAFLQWLDTCAESGKFHPESSKAEGESYTRTECSANKFSMESSALDSFHLSERGSHISKASAQISDVVSCFVLTARNQKKRKEAGGLLETVLCVSNQNDRWDVWAGDDDKGISIFFSRKKDQQLAFIPSILFICVGISVMIILTNFIYQFSSALETKTVIISTVDKLRDFNFIFQNLAIGSLNMAGCIDPVQLQKMNSVRLTTYAQELVEWPPVSSEIENAMQGPAVSGLLNSLVNPSVEDLVSGTFIPDLKARLKTELPAILFPALFSILVNMTHPEVLSTLPVYGPTIGCLIKQLGSEEVQTFLNQSMSKVNSQASKAQIRISTTSTDTCR
jgi:hypothetical protein